MSDVTYENVYKRFGDVVAVEDMNLKVEDKEFLVLVGPSGCGKTTSLRLLAGLDDISEGKIKIADRVVNDVAPKDRDIAMVFQSYALYPHMTVFDNMAFGLKLRNVPSEEIKSRVEDAAEILGIGNLLQRRPRQLSGGQRQRVAVGRAIVRKPAVFLFDEPLSNLDAKLRVQTRAEIQELHHRLQTTFIYVTHDQTEAMTMATRIAVMKDGLLQQVDAPQTLYDYPDNVFVAGFIGSPAMNFFDARVERANGGLMVNTKAFQVRIPDEKASTYEPIIGEDVIFGLRPEDIHDPDYMPPGVKAAEVDSKVRVREPMGNELILYLEKDGLEFVSRLDPRSQADVNAEKQVAFNMDNMHIFETEGDQKAIR